MYHDFCIHSSADGHPFICWRTSRLLPRPGCCKQHCSDRWGACVFQLPFSQAVCPVGTTSSVSIRLLTDIQAASVSWLLRMVLRWTLGYTYLFELLSCPGIWPGTWLLDHMIILVLVFWGTSTLVSIVAAPPYVPTNGVGGLPSLHTLSSMGYL